MLRILALFAVSGLVACGSPSDRNALPEAQQSRSIVNGSAVTSNDVVAKSTVAFYIGMQDGSIQQYCSGTLIDKRTVLTAAHCFVTLAEQAKITPEQVAEYSAVAFGLPRVSKVDAKGITFLRIKGVAVHPDYRTDQLQTVLEKAMPDVAVVKLDADAPAGYVPATLATSKDTIKKGLEFTISGYGKINGFGTDATELRKVAVTVEEPALNPVQFAYMVQGGRSFCSGDSGGPAYISNGLGGLFVIGVISFADRGCSMMGGLTSVPALATWIQANK